MTPSFKKATKTQARLRLALSGPSGSGKTWTALVLAKALGERIAVIDTERASASKYAGEVADFDSLDMATHAPAEYIAAIEAAAAEGYPVLVIDSLSHAWMGRGGALEQVDNAAKRSQSGNSFMAWRDVTPQHNALVDAILTYPGHVIVTMRSHMEYVLEEGKNGKKTPRKVGMKPVQRDGVEYEFDVSADMDMDHNLMVSKTRCAALDGAIIKKPDAKLAAILLAWLTDGTPLPAAPPVPATTKDEDVEESNRTYWRKRVFAVCAERGVTTEAEPMRALCSKIVGREVDSRSKMSAADWRKVYDNMPARDAPLKEAG